jgi:hypothetical protein
MSDDKQLKGIEDWEQMYEQADGTVGEFVSSQELDRGVKLTFLADNPEEKDGDYGKQLIFPVKTNEGMEKTLGIGSKRLAGKIANHKKRLGGTLTGHTFYIKRTGEKFDTKYSVQEVKPDTEVGE